MRKYLVIRVYEEPVSHKWLCNCSIPNFLSVYISVFGHCMPHVGIARTAYVTTIRWCKCSRKDRLLPVYWAWLNQLRWSPVLPHSQCTVSVPSGGVSNVGPGHFFHALWYPSYVQPERKGEWWLVPDFETEVNGDSWSTFCRDPSLVGTLLLGSSCRSSLGCSSNPPPKLHKRHCVSVSLFLSNIQLQLLFKKPIETRVISVCDVTVPLGVYQEHPAEEQRPAGGLHWEGAHPRAGAPRHAHHSQADISVSALSACG